MQEERLRQALSRSKETEERLRAERNRYAGEVEKQTKIINKLLWDIQQLQEELTSVRENHSALRMKILAARTMKHAETQTTEQTPHLQHEVKRQRRERNVEIF